MPLYSLYVPKHYGTLSLLPKVIQDFFCVNNGRRFELTISPGYLGEGSEFISKVTNILIGHVSSLTVYKGMTSDQRHKNSTLALGRSLGVSVSYIFTKNDHRKMIFFRYENNTEAVLVGSSNVSTATYFKSSKGEADLFLFYSEEFKNACCNNISSLQDNGGNAQRENVNDQTNRRENDTPQENTDGYRYCVLSESITMNYEPHTYLNDIYAEFTNSGLHDNA